MWVFPKIVVPQNGWFIRENLIRIDDLWYHYFRKHPCHPQSNSTAWKISVHPKNALLHVIPVPSTPYRHGPKTASFFGVRFIQVPEKNHAPETPGGSSPWVTLEFLISNNIEQPWKYTWKLEPVFCPLFLGLNPPKEGRNSNQNNGHGFSYSITHLVFVLLLVSLVCCILSYEAPLA